MPSLTRNEYDALVLAVAWLAGFTPVFLRKPGWSWRCGVGLALLATPFVRMALDLYLNIGALFVFTVLQPVSELALWSSVQTRLLEDLVLPLVGIFLIADAFPGFGSAPPIRALEAHGLAPRRSWRWDALRGLGLFFAIAAAFLVAYGVDRFIPATLAGGDESQYWKNITIPLIVLLSASSGIAEEFLFRGVLLTAFSRRMPFWAAAGVQAVLFGFVHSGYGTWTHVVGPALFGLGMAWVVRVLGIVPAAVLHAEVNVLFFALDVAPAYGGSHGPAGPWELLALVVGMAAASAWALWRTRADAVRLMWESLRRRGSSRRAA